MTTKDPTPAVAAAIEANRLLLTVDQTADRLAMSRSEVYRWMRVTPGRPVLPFLKLGRARRIDAAALARFVVDLNQWQGNEVDGPGDGS